MTEGLLFLGANGHVGLLLRRIGTAGFVPPETPVHWQSRHRIGGRGGITWVPGAPWSGPAPEVIVALWGVTGGTEEHLAGNTTLACAALDLARQTGARLVLHMSSGAVHTGAFGDPVTEATPPRPASAYGRAKLQMEQAIGDWHLAHPGGPRSVILRLANVAGADMLFRNMRRPGAITLDRFADGTGPRRSYIAPRDLMRVIAALATAPPDSLPRILNVAGLKPVAMEQILAAAGWPLRWRQAPDAALPQLWLDTARLQALTGPLPDSADPEALAIQGLGQDQRAERLTS